MTKVYSILGATGHIGRVLTEELLRKGHTVRAIGRDKNKLSVLKGKKAQIYSLDFTQVSSLEQVFEGADAIFSLLPPATHTDDLAKYQDQVGEAIALAVVDAKIRHVLNLSSIGAEITDKTGPITGLHKHEERLNSLLSVDVLHLRAGWFMQNFLWDLCSIISDSSIYSSIDGDLKLPMVDTQDIGFKAAELLDKLAFTGKSYFDFMGPAFVSLSEAVNVFSKALDKKLHFVQLTYDEHAQAMLKAGMKKNTVNLMIEMIKGFNKGLIHPTQELTREHLGKLSIEDFATTVLSKSYEEQKSMLAKQ